MQAKDSPNRTVQSSQDQSAPAVTGSDSAAISISADSWPGLESAFPLSLTEVVLWLVGWVLLQLGLSEANERGLDFLPVSADPLIQHAVAFSLATALLLLYVKLIRRRKLGCLGLRLGDLHSDLAWFLVACLAMGAIYVALGGLLYLGLVVFTSDATGEFKQQLQEAVFKDYSLWPMLRVVVLYPILEEIWYRGLLYTPIRRERGRVIALLLTALIFAYAHAVKWPVNQFIGGLCFATAFEYRRNLLVPVLLHMAGNGALALLGWSLLHWNLLA